MVTNAFEMITSTINFRSSRCVLRQSFLFRNLSTTANDANKLPVPSDPSRKDSGSSWDHTYRQLQNLDFATAAKILFSDQQRTKKFGLDFHLVQFFFACMPSLAVYLVAQYARSEIRKMEAEEELKRKQKELEEDKEKESEEDSKEAGQESYSELHKVKIRLDTIEETIKEIFDERKKLPASISKDQNGGSSNQNIVSVGKACSYQNKPMSTKEEPQSTKEAVDGPTKTNNAPIVDASKQVMKDEKGALSGESKKMMQ